ncbi:hypothetical protein A1O1_02113 [Capronia coronata CBS 617.96]|uniref:Gamma-glutamylcyclotransferase AIG2-like domain-containing protein n=1 Tax=Capronia coronata CBS 617.96 TaxID=1182541 RepID=W9YVK6_9EURO|nr:uncharacterized protein A1O1_02113 [Capronia coronata CBS 617.96]EXJ93720.1 hypothetical protein A1O1_02113 [Capronia coronata CBS 617.96]
MDVLAEMEAVAVSMSECVLSTNVSDVDAERWQRLFGYTHSEAVGHIEEHRNNYPRGRIQDDVWMTVRSRKEAEGYDREAYEYSLTDIAQLQHQHCVQCDTTEQNQPGTEDSIIQLEDPLDTPEKIQWVAGLTETPTVLIGSGTAGETRRFCRISPSVKARVLAWLAQYHPGFRPTVARLYNMARHNISSSTMAPMTPPINGGRYTLFPPSTLPDPVEQYPIWYFFYGRQTHPKLLLRQLGVNLEPTPVRARLEGARLRTLGAGKYEALVDGGAGSAILGWACRIDTNEQEDALRFYETEKHELVRCHIVTEYGTVPGRTFRFAGSVEELD